jgi:hypothetical protein
MPGYPLFKKISVLKSFGVTGIWLMDSSLVLQRFTHAPSPDAFSPLYLADSDWIYVERVLRIEVR